MRKIFILITLFLCLGCFPQQSKDSSDNKVDFQITLSSKIDTSLFDKIWIYIKDLLGPAVALIGILLSLRLLRKKLIENHVTKQLVQIQDTNREVQKQCEKLIDNYLPKFDNNEKLNIKEAEATFVEIQELYYLALDSSSDVVTMLFYLKTTLQGALKYYKSTNESFITTREYYRLILGILQRTVFYTTKVIPIPKSTKTESKYLINKKIRKFVRNTDYSQFKYFSHGIIYDSLSAHYILFYSKVNYCHPYIQRAAYKIYDDYKPILRILYSIDIYAPPFLESEDEAPVFGTMKLNLIGISHQTEVSFNEAPNSKIVELTYSNTNDIFNFVDESLKFEKFKTKFHDTLFNFSEFDLNEAKSMKNIGFESIIVKFDLEYLKQKFKANKYKINEAMKK